MPIPLCIVPKTFVLQDPWQKVRKENLRIVRLQDKRFLRADSCKINPSRFLKMRIPGYQQKIARFKAVIEHRAYRATCYCPSTIEVNLT